MAEIPITELTTGIVEGTGVFDELMESVGAHLQNEYKAKRITGTDYSRVYSAAMTAVLAQSVQFVLSKQQADKQAELTVAQTLLVDEQRAEQTKRLELNGLLDQQVLQLVAQIDQIEAQTALTGTQNTKTGSENELVLAQELKVDAEKLVVDQQLLKLVEDTNTAREETQVAANTHAKLGSEKLLVDQNVLNAQEQNTLLKKQQTKVEEETDLLKLKQETEGGQTQDTLQDGVTPIAGSIGRQNVVYEKQAAGFDRDAEQQAAKIYADMNNIRMSTEREVVEPTAKISDAESAQAMNNLLDNMHNPPAR